MRLSTLLLLCLLACQSVNVSDAGSNFTILLNVQIIDPEKGRLEQVDMLILKDSLIHYVGKNLPESKLPNGKTFDLHNKFLTPPLWDMHFHLSWDANNDSLLFPLLLSKGILGLRDMGGDLEILREMKSRLTENPNYGPGLYGAGPILDGNPPVMYDFSMALDASLDIEKILDSLKAGSADFLKTYSLLKEAELRRIAKYSRRHKLSFQGHLSEYVAPELALDLGQKSIEHLNRLEEIWKTDTARISKIADQMLEKGTWICPTLVIYQKKAFMNDATISLPEYEPYIHPMLKQEWEQSKKRRLAGIKEEDWTQARELYDQQKALLTFLYKKGVKILAGSDFAGMPFVYPGLGLWEELDQLKAAGIPDAEILKIATYHPIQFFQLEHTRGTLEKGKIADFLVLEKNPLEDIKYIQTIERIFRYGREVILEKP